MATKKTAKKTTKKAPTKARRKPPSSPSVDPVPSSAPASPPEVQPDAPVPDAPVADALEAVVGGWHEQAAAGEDPAAEPPAEALEAESAAVPAVREEADDSEAEEAVASFSATPLSTTVAMAMRFVDPKKPIVQITPTWCIGVGSRGAVFAPWSAPGLDETGHLVDGKALTRMLRAAGADAALSVRVGGGGVVVKGGAHRFTLRVSSDELSIPTFPDPSSYEPFDPSLFLLAAPFAGKADIIPPELSGVQVAPGYIASTDRMGLFYGLQPSTCTLRAVLPSDTFDDVNEQVYVAKDARGNVFVAVPSSGEYRMVVPWTDAVVDVKAVGELLPIAFTVEVSRALFLDALKKATIVQRRTSSIKVDVITQKGDAQMELRAEDPMATSEFVARLAAAVTGGAPPDSRYTVLCSGENLERLAKLCPSPTGVTLCFGAPTDPVVVQSDAFRAAGLAMR